MQAKRIAAAGMLSCAAALLPAAWAAAAAPDKGAGQTLYNGIVLPEDWPPRMAQLPRDPVQPPYLESPPKVIPIDVGRQLFVDDFLVEQTTLTRTFHQAEYYEQNPVLKPDQKICLYFFPLEVNPAQ